MLHSYEAQLQGNQVIWLGVPPPPQAQPRRVVVVVDEPENGPPATIVMNILQRARGSLGHGSRDAVLAALEQSRQEWER